DVSSLIPQSGFVATKSAHLSLDFSNHDLREVSQIATTRSALPYWRAPTLEAVCSSDFPQQRQRLAQSKLPGQQDAFDALVRRIGFEVLLPQILASKSQPGGVEVIFGGPLYDLRLVGRTLVPPRGVAHPAARQIDGDHLAPIQPDEERVGQAFAPRLGSVASGRTEDNDRIFVPPITRNRAGDVRMVLQLQVHAETECCICVSPVTHRSAASEAQTSSSSLRAKTWRFA